MRETKPGRGYNMAEYEFELKATRKGIEVIRRGYPDFSIVRDGRIIGFVEVKPKSETARKPHQEMFRKLCEEHGIPFHYWKPGDDVSFT